MKGFAFDLVRRKLMNLKIEQVDSKKEEEVEIGFEIEKRVVVVEPVVELEPKLVEQLVVG